MDNSTYCNLVKWVDIKGVELGGEVSGIDVISETDFDYVVVAIASFSARNNALKTLVKLGVDSSKIIYIGC